MICRPERHRHILNQLRKIGAPTEKVHQIEAVTIPSNPQVGCAMSHLKALSDARRNEYEIILILEDDFTFRTNREQLDLALEGLYQTNWEVVQLSTVNAKSRPGPFRGLDRVIRADTTAAYLVRGEAIVPIFNVFLQCCQRRTGMPKMATNQMAIDVAWQTLQSKMNWYLYQPVLGYQSERFPSDIEGFRGLQHLLS